MIEELEARMRNVDHDGADTVLLPMGTSPSSQIIKSLQHDKDRQAKEFLLLRKTIDEMELRIDTQKQTLNAREESIKKLLEMLQNKGTN
jgi:ELKS/RAB6-interacting/CAST family protein 1